MADTQKFGVPLDLTGNELRNAIIQILSSSPAVALGRVYYDSTANGFRGYNGTEFVHLDARLRTGIPLANLATDPLARANHTGTQAASTISDLAATVQAYRLDQFADPTSNIDMDGFTFLNLPDPTSAQQPATRQYVDDAIAGAASGLDPHEEVVAATTGSITLSGAQTIDGVNVVATNRVLVKNQGTASQNGIYVAAAGAWTRATDADGAGELDYASTVAVLGGVTNGGTTWFLSTPGPITIGTTAQTWVLFTSSTAYTAGFGLSLTGRSFAVSPASGGGIEADVTGVYLSADVSRGYTTNLSGSSTTYTVTHNLGTKNVVVQVYENATDDLWVVGVQTATTNTVVVTFASAPASNAYRCSVVKA